MADMQNKTTSSKTLDGKHNEDVQKMRSPLAPRSSEAHILTKLAQNLSESYQLVKQRQQKYNELSAKAGENGGATLSGDEWQEVCYAKNKLKRKKKLSTSLTSVSDSVNQEKRTRIEGMQLNCRGKLQLKDIGATATHTTPTTPPVAMHGNAVAVQQKDKVAIKPPPQSTTDCKTARESNGSVTPQPQGEAQAMPDKVPPPRLKRKLQEHVQTIHKLHALTEQLRLEINELKTNLTTERGAVRVLRANNDAETRKWKNEVKKLQNTVEQMKKSNAVQSSGVRKLTDSTQATNVEYQPNAAPGSMANYEIQRLTNEITALKEANKALEEKKLINCDADRRKAADMRTLKDNYEIRLTQLTKSAKTEISRLLEELKTKERNIGQLKKELHVLQSKSQIQNDNKNSRNATTINSTNKTTTKPKRTNAKPKQNSNETTPAKNEYSKDASPAQAPNEMKKLKDIELINNTKNLKNNVVNLKTTTKLHTNIQNNKYKSLEVNDVNKKTVLSDENLNNLLKTSTTTTTTATTTATTTTTTMTTTCGHHQQQEYLTMPHEITERLLGTAIEVPSIDTTPPTITTTATITLKKEPKNVLEYRTKDNNSDTDSAVSSAPPSISPQPPPAGLETTDIWQMIRTYTTDIEKLQKDIELLQKENKQLNNELNLAKEQILETEKTALEATKNSRVKEFIERIKYLEEQEHQLQIEANELREQNELLEFRVLELEESNDKWSLQSHSPPSPNTITSQTNSLPTTKDVWGTCVQANQDDPMQMLFGNNTHMDSGITSPMDNAHDIEEDMTIMDATNEEIRHRLRIILKKYNLEAEDKRCLHQLCTLLHQLDALLQRNSGPDSLNTTSSSEGPSSLELVKSRVSDYSSASSSPSTYSTHDNVLSTKYSKSANVQGSTANCRIVATVPPYNSSGQQQHVPANTPTDSPRKSRYPWQSNSLSESGVFVESDFYSDTSENNVCTQTDFDDTSVNTSNTTNVYTCNTKETLNQNNQRYETKLSPHKYSPFSPSQLSPNLSDQKRLLYYKERLELLEGKVLIYESSGDLQTKRLADRLQREIQLDKQLKELQDRVDYLEQENSTLEEEKCEFEEAENDTRLRLQRLEVELEILSQRSVELEMSREALGAKYKDCRSECLNLKDDLSAAETQICHLEEDKLKAKGNLEFLHSILPLLFIYYYFKIAVLSQEVQEQTSLQSIEIDPRYNMGNTESAGNCLGDAQADCQALKQSTPQPSPRTLKKSSCPSEMTPAQLKEEINKLRSQIQELNSRHYEALETADSHWAELEREYKNRECAYRAKETCLKQKITQLTECMRDDARAADEKITQLEETEKQLTTCLLRMSKEHREAVGQHQSLLTELECLKEQQEKNVMQQKPLADALEAERKRNKCLLEEVNFMRKLQQDIECRGAAEVQALRCQLIDLKKEYLHIEVTNSELREEVATLEHELGTLQKVAKENYDKVRTLTDEVRTKEEICERLERNLERNEGLTLAHELSGSPMKRPKREDVKDLRTASAGLNFALNNFRGTDCKLPSHEHFQRVACGVKKLADTLLQADSIEAEVSSCMDGSWPDTDSYKSSARKGKEKQNTTVVCTNLVEQPSKPKETVCTSEKRASELPKHSSETLDRLDKSKELEQKPTSFSVTPSNASNKSGDSDSKTKTVEKKSSDTSRKSDDAEKSGLQLTVAMSFVPEFSIPENMLPQTKEKAICEVPSELRKLSTVPATEGETPNENNKPIKEATKSSGCCLKCRKRRQRRYLMKLGGVPMRIHNIVSGLISHPSRIFDNYQTELQPHTYSTSSFFSVENENSANSIVMKKDASTEIDVTVIGNRVLENKGMDKGTIIFIDKKDSAVQVNDEITAERLMAFMPTTTRTFLTLLKASFMHNQLLDHDFNMGVIHRWEMDDEFRNGLDVLQRFANSDEVEACTLENYEEFVSAMSCLHILEEIFKPFKLSMLREIEDKINEQLMSFHTKKMEVEFYCDVYYPVPRARPEALI